MKADKIKIEQSWKEVLSEEFEKPYFDNIVSHLRALKKENKSIYPPWFADLQCL